VEEAVVVDKRVDCCKRCLAGAKPLEILNLLGAVFVDYFI
jgi:hypothetical protein